MSKEREIRFPETLEEKAYCMRRLLEERARQILPKGTSIQFWQFPDCGENTGILYSTFEIGDGKSPLNIVLGMVTLSGEPIECTNFASYSSSAYWFVKELNEAKGTKR